MQETSRAESHRFTNFEAKPGSYISEIQTILLGHLAKLLDVHDCSLNSQALHNKMIRKPRNFRLTCYKILKEKLGVVCRKPLYSQKVLQGRIRIKRKKPKDKETDPGEKEFKNRVKCKDNFSMNQQCKNKTAVTKPDIVTLVKSFFGEIEFSASSYSAASALIA